MKYLKPYDDCDVQSYNFFKNSELNKNETLQIEPPEQANWKFEENQINITLTNQEPLNLKKVYMEKYKSEYQDKWSGRGGEENLYKLTIFFTSREAAIEFNTIGQQDEIPFNRHQYVSGLNFEISGACLSNVQKYLQILFEREKVPPFVYDILNRKFGCSLQKNIEECDCIELMQHL
ncbi:MAG: hypothetical protein H0T84_10900 [Tatlockia sp.]|nr:hypothetical protein [Tatlockia sp.]